MPRGFQQGSNRVLDHSRVYGIRYGTECQQRSNRVPTGAQMTAEYMELDLEPGSNRVPTEFPDDSRVYGIKCGAGFQQGSNRVPDHSRVYGIRFGTGCQQGSTRVPDHSREYGIRFGTRFQQGSNSIWNQICDRVPTGFQQNANPQQSISKQVAPFTCQGFGTNFPARDEAEDIISTVFASKLLHKRISPKSNSLRSAQAEYIKTGRTIYLPGLWNKLSCQG